MEDDPDLKKQKKSPPSPNEAEHVFRRAYWNQTYFGAVAESVPSLMSLDQVSLEHEVQNVDFDTPQRQRLRKGSAYPIDFYYITNENPNFIPAEECLYAVELYGRYLSKEKGLTQPIFSVSDYLDKNITFHIFLINPQHQTLKGIVIFDNYETEDQETFSLRAEWWFPSFRDTFRSGDYIKGLAKLHDNYDVKFILSPESLKPMAKSQIRQFGVNPITVTYGDALYRYNWEERLKHQFLRLKFPNMEENFNRAEALLEEQLNTQDLPSLLSGIGNYTPETTLTNPTFLCHWETFSKLAIQIPLLHPAAFQDYPRLQTADNHFDCLEFTEKAPQAVKDLVKRYIYYLRTEIGCQLPYEGDERYPHDIYLVMNPQRSLCIGLFMFRKINYQNFFEEKKQQYLNYLDGAEVEDEILFEEFEEEISKNKAKLEADDKRLIPEPLSFNPFAYDSDQKRKKHEAKLAWFTGLNFFAHAKNHLPPKLEEVALLQAAWIHPFYRRQGILATLWPIFQAKYGSFAVDDPSPSMKQFIEKQGLATFPSANRHTFVAP